MTEHCSAPELRALREWVVPVRVHDVAEAGRGDQHVKNAGVGAHWKKVPMATVISFDIIIDFVFLWIGKKIPSEIIGSFRY